MAQPNLIIVPFASSAPAGNVDAIPISLGPSDPPQAASYSQGFPQVTMTPLAAGGIPPRGQSFNGVFQDITEHLVYIGHGGQYRWSDAYVAAKGGYDAGDVLQSNDGLTSYVSLINNNTANFNTNPGSIGTAWQAWAGAGAVPPDASTSTKGLIRVATQAQVNTGASGDLAVTPLALAVSVQNQAVSAFLASGTATAQAISPLPSITAYTTFQRFNVTFSVASGVNPTINVSGVGARLLKRYSPAGAKVAATFAAGQNSDIVYDGVDFIVLNPLPLDARAVTDGVFNVAIVANSGLIAPQGTSVLFRDVAGAANLYKTGHDVTTWSLITAPAAGGEIAAINIRRSDGLVTLAGLTTPSITGNTTVTTQPPGTNNGVLANTAFVATAVGTRIIGDKCPVAGFAGSAYNTCYMKHTDNTIVYLRPASLVDTATFGTTSASKNIDTGEIIQYFDVALGDISGTQLFPITYPFQFPTAATNFQVTFQVPTSSELCGCQASIIKNTISKSGVTIQVAEWASIVQTGLVLSVEVRGY